MSTIRLSKTGHTVLKQMEAYTGDPTMSRNLDLLMEFFSKLIYCFADASGCRIDREVLEWVVETVEMNSDSIPRIDTFQKAKQEAEKLKKRVQRTSKFKKAVFEMVLNSTDPSAEAFILSAAQKIAAENERSEPASKGV